LRQSLNIDNELSKTKNHKELRGWI